MSETAEIEISTDGDGFETAQYKTQGAGSSDGGKAEEPEKGGPASEPAAEVQSSEPGSESEGDNSRTEGGEEDGGKRLQDLHKRVRLAEKARREAEEALQRLKGEKPADPEADRQLEIQREAKRLAALEIEQQKVGNVINRGRAEYGAEFDGYIRTMFETGQAQGVSEGIPQVVSQMITNDLDNPTKVVQYFGKNPDKYEQLVGMTPNRQAIELARLSMQLERKPQVKAPPPPIQPITGTNKSAPSLEDMDMDDYHKMRSEQRSKRRLFS